MANDTTVYTLYPELTVDERGRYFDGQFLTAQDFVDEQRYHVDRQRRTLDHLTVAGVADGLDVTAAGTWKINVAKGTAIDGQGRLLVLAAAIQNADVPKDIPGGVVEVALYYAEVESRLRGGTSEEAGTRGASRLRELPALEFYMPGGQVPHPGSVPLARLQVTNTGAITIVAPTPFRRFAGLRLPSSGDAAPTLRSGGPARPSLVGLTGDLQVTGKLGVGTEDPESELDVRGLARVTQLSIREQTFKVAGDEATFYPIVFRDLGWTAGAMDLEISRPNAQADVANAGSMLLRLRWHAADGQGSELLGGELVQSRRFVANVKVLGKDRLIAVWLRGNRSYAWRANHRAELADGQAAAKNLGGEQLDARAAIDPFFDRDRFQFTPAVDRQELRGAATVAGDLAYTGFLNKLDTNENASATVRAADFNFGHTTRHGKTGRALVDDTKTLVINYAADWEVTRLGGRVEAEGDTLVKGALTVNRSDGHLTLTRPGDSKTGGGQMFLELIQRDGGQPAVPEVGPSIRFHHEYRHWRRIESRTTGFHLRTGDFTKDDYVDLFINDLKARDLKANNLTLDGNITTDIRGNAKLNVAGDATLGGKLSATGDATLGGKLDVAGDVKLGGALTGGKGATFADNVTVTRETFHLQLARTNANTTGGVKVFLELYQNDPNSKVPDTYPAIRFHHNNRFWHRIEARANGLHVRDGNDASDDWKPLYAGDMFANSFHVATGPAERLRIIRGTVNGSGNVEVGGGFTLARDPNWLTKVIFSTPFASAPSVVVTQQYPDNNSSGDGGNTKDNATVVKVDRFAAWIKCGDGDGSGSWRRFHFIAVGP